MLGEQCEAACIAKKSYVYSGIECVGCPSPATSCPLTCRLALRAGCAGAVSQRWELSLHGKRNKGKGQVFVIVVGSLLGMTSGEREGRDDVVRNANGSSQRAALTWSGKRMV